MNGGGRDDCQCCRRHDGRASPRVARTSNRQVPSVRSRLRRRESRVPSIVQRGLGDLPSRPCRRRWRGHRCDRVRFRSDPGDEGVGARDDGHGHHLLHGQHRWRPPEPGGHPRVRGPRELPVATRPGLHRRPDHRGGPRLGLPAADVRRHHQRCDRADARREPGGRGPDRGDPDPGSRERHPRDGDRRPQYRLQRRDRGRRLHRARVGVGRSGDRRVDEPGALSRADARRWRPDQLLDLSRGPAPRRDGRGRVRVDPAWRADQGGRGSGSGHPRRRKSGPPSDHPWTNSEPR